MDIFVTVNVKKGVSKTWANAKSFGGKTIQTSKDLYSRMKSCVKRGIKCFLPLSGGNYYLLPKGTGAIVVDSKPV